MQRLLLLELQKGGDEDYTKPSMKDVGLGFSSSSAQSAKRFGRWISMWLAVSSRDGGAKTALNDSTTHDLSYFGVDLFTLKC